MRGFTRRRPARSVLVRGAIGGGLTPLEPRLLMANRINPYYHPSFLQPNIHQPASPPLQVNHPIGNGPRVLSKLDNDGKILTGTDREGDQWQITVHGPGAIIVTDATPNDGVLDDDLDTIQIVGSDPNKTFVTGNVTASARVITEGTVSFQRLIALNGVHSIVLNGFTLEQTTDPPDNVKHRGIEVYLPGGVGLLQFHDINAPIDTANNDQSIDIQIGERNSPLKRKPIIRLDSIFNTVFNSTLAANPPGIPRTDPTVRIEVNGEIRGLEYVSSTSQPIPQAGRELAFPISTVTGRTSVRATGIGNLKVIGSARNTTFSRGRVPFRNGFSGMNKLGHASFGGVADGVGIDVSQGNIGRLRFLRGLGDPTGALPGDTNLGVPESQWGYPAFGKYGGLVVAQRLGGLKAAPANLVFQTGQDPSRMQIDMTNWTKFYTRGGRAMTNGVIAIDGDIGHTVIVGDLQGSEIKAGFNYNSFVNGLDGTRAPSKVGPLRMRGSLVNSVVSATYRPTNRIYGDVDEVTGRTDDVAGPGKIVGKLQQGGLYRTPDGQTALGNIGSGFFARDKVGYLPPPQRPWRVHAVNRGG